MLIRNDYPRRIALGASALAALVTVAAVIAIAEGKPRAGLLATSPVLLCCAVLAVVGWRRERSWMTFTACAGIVAAAFGGSWLFAS
ncbi:hypothetical protein BX264_5051 [Streptomyces sp. 2333.5]|uniref:hypothetical protein n=1 Tax=Streptomyces TaxID=1883 RepID=UPI00089B1F27|nr:MULTISPECIES: hypothetical protein [unclassified Streptomyces]PJJ04641.1 hypothetical protein BX264_5051 [Streptomyces sp. 2333.5]SEE56779.1 hypothetical protein SAMN05428943_5161 [Streptomyces sp. 2314.4]SEE83807.1 hypothetical protein SAMN05428942_5152 [Streptomyces sp. 2112.2]